MALKGTISNLQSDDCAANLLQHEHSGGNGIL